MQMQEFAFISEERGLRLRLGICNELPSRKVPIIAPGETHHERDTLDYIMYAKIKGCSSDRQFAGVIRIFSIFNVLA